MADPRARGGVLALACLAVAFVNHDRGTGLEGAYFDSAEDEGNLAAPTLAFGADSWFDPFDWGSPYLWLGAGVALAVVGAVVLLMSLRRPASRPAP